MTREEGEREGPPIGAGPPIRPQVSVGGGGDNAITITVARHCQNWHWPSGDGIRKTCCRGDYSGRLS